MMTLEVAVGLALGVVGVVAGLRGMRHRRTPLGQASLALVEARRRRLGGAPVERLHAFEWSILVVVGLIFLAWAAAPIVAEAVGAARFGEGAP